MKTVAFVPIKLNNERFPGKNVKPFTGGKPLIAYADAIIETAKLFDIPVLELCERIAKLGCGHHWMIGYGDVSAELEAFCKERGVIYQRVDA